MHRGDISSSVAPRWLFQFEGVIADLPPSGRLRFKAAARLGRYGAAVSAFDLHPHVGKVLWDLTYRRDYRFDCFTHLGPSFAVAVQDWLDAHDLPVGHVLAATPQEVARRVVAMPNVQYVVHASTDNHLTYGNRGLLVTDPERLRLS